MLWRGFRVAVYVYIKNDFVFVCVFVTMRYVYLLRRLIRTEKKNMNLCTMKNF